MILVIIFSNVHDKNHINAPKAGLIDFCILFWRKNSPTNAQANGHKINHTGQANNQIIIHMMHHRFHRLDHQNFLVHSIGR
jgi:hypothetical protein